MWSEGRNRRTEPDTDDRYKLFEFLQHTKILDRHITGEIGQKYIRRIYRVFHDILVFVDLLSIASRFFCSCAKYEASLSVRPTKQVLLKVRYKPEGYQQVVVDHHGVLDIIYAQNNAHFWFMDSILKVKPHNCWPSTCHAPAHCGKCNVCSFAH